MHDDLVNIFNEYISSPNFDKYTKLKSRKSFIHAMETELNVSHLLPKPMKVSLHDGSARQRRRWHTVGDSTSTDATGWPQVNGTVETMWGRWQEKISWAVGGDDSGDVNATAAAVWVRRREQIICDGSGDDGGNVRWREKISCAGSGNGGSFLNAKAMSRREQIGCDCRSNGGADVHWREKISCAIGGDSDGDVNATAGRQRRRRRGEWDGG